jgi:small-conductance mechanosensitive channel
MGNEVIIEKWAENPLAQKAIIVLLSFVLLAILLHIIKRELGRHVKDLQTRYKVRRIISFLGYLTAFLFAVSIFGERFGNIQVAFGIAGAGIAFSLQEVIVSVAGWLAITFGNFYKPGERVQLGGIMGDVIDIGILRTTIMECGQWVRGDQYNGRIVRVANSFVFKEPVFNYSADFPFLWDEVNVPVKYGGDYQLAREIFLRVLNEVIGDYTNYAQEAWKDVVTKYLIEDASVAPMIIMEFTDNWVAFTLRYVVDYKQRRFLKGRIFSRVLEEIEKTDGRIAVASSTFQLVGVPPVVVNIEKEL